LNITKKAAILKLYKAKKTRGRRSIKMFLKRKEGIIMSLGSVHRYMSILGIASTQRKRKSSKELPLEKSTNTLQNVLNGDFKALHPNQKWVTDITYTTCKDSTLYLSCIKDLYDNSIISYKISNKNNLELVIDTLTLAFDKVGYDSIKGLILHSDRGIQYTSKLYDKILRMYDIKPSYSRKGSPTQNAPIESFYSTFKQECFRLIKNKTKQIVTSTIDEFIYYYNEERPQYNKKELTPSEFRYQFSY